MFGACTPHHTYVLEAITLSDGVFMDYMFQTDDGHGERDAFDSDVMFDSWEGGIRRDSEVHKFSLDWSGSNSFTSTSPPG